MSEYASFEVLVAVGKWLGFDKVEGEDEDDCMDECELYLDACRNEGRNVLKRDPFLIAAQGGAT